jgi:hypothetical protein
MLAVGNVLGLQGDFDLFADTLSIGESRLDRQGVGRMRRWFITGVDVALYLPAGTKREDILDDVPRALSFYYYVSIRGDQFARAASEALQQNVSPAKLAKHASDIEKMGSWFSTVEPGDRYLLYYEPDRGTALALNGKEVGVIPGNEFAEIYFQIWLGKKPVDQKMYEGLTKNMP